MPSPSRPFDLFISYHRDDQQKVERLGTALQKRGLRVFIDCWYLPAGQPWQSELERHLREARAVAVILGAGEIGPSQKLEVELALDRQAHEPGLAVIPVLFAPVDPSGRFLFRNTWVDMHSSIDDPAALDALVAAVRGPASEPVDEYSGVQGVALAKILDHGEHLEAIGKLFAPFNGGAATDRAIALFDACAEDWPSYLADHVHLHPWPDGDATPPEAIPLNPARIGTEAFWEAFIDGVPGARDVSDPAEQCAMVRDWVNGAPLRVYHVTVQLEREGRRLPAMIRSAHATLTRLGALAPGTRLLVLFTAVTRRGRPPFWWPWFKRFRLQAMGCCHSLDALRPLDKSDIERWYGGFPRQLLGYYNRDRLKAELLTLFSGDTIEIRYEQARHRLVEEQAIERARK